MSSFLISNRLLTQQRFIPKPLRWLVSCSFSFHFIHQSQTDSWFWHKKWRKRPILGCLVACMAKLATQSPPFRGLSKTEGRGDPDVGDFMTCSKICGNQESGVESCFATHANITQHSYESNMAFVLRCLGRFHAYLLSFSVGGRCEFLSWSVIPHGQAQMFVDITIYEAVVLAACDQGLSRAQQRHCIWRMFQDDLVRRECENIWDILSEPLL